MLFRSGDELNQALKASSSMPFLSDPQETSQGLCLDGGIADSIPYDIAQQQGFDKIVVVRTRDAKYRKKPSSRAVKELSKKKCLLKKDDGTLSLTDSGLQIATQIYEKHQFFTRQLIEAGVHKDIAAQDACRLEHVISEQSF